MRRRKTPRFGSGPSPVLLDARGRPLGSRPVDRRGFVKTSGGILVATALGSACKGDVAGPEGKGTIVVTISGVPTGQADYGSAFVTEASDPSFQLTIPLTVASGTADVPAGTYHVIYSAPQGYQVSGSNEFDVTIVAGQTTPVDVALTVIVAQGTMRVTVSGLSGSSLGGSASLLQTDISGQTPVTVPVPQAGIVDSVVSEGTYTVTYTPPSGFAVNSGVTNPQTGVQVTAGSTTVVTFSVTATSGGNFPTPDILNNGDFEDTDADIWAGFRNGSAQNPGPNCVRDKTLAFAGGASVLLHLPVTSGVDHGNTMIHPINPGLDRIHGRFYFYFDAAITGTLKFQIYEAKSGAQFGGVYCFNGVIKWFFVDWFGFTTGQYLPIAAINSLLNGWHSLEVDNWRNGHPSGFPAVGLWLDGKQITSGTIPSGASFDANGYCVAGLRVAGPFPLPTATEQIGTYNILGVLNGSPNNTVPANLWIDDVAISSVGRVGP